MFQTEFRNLKKKIKQVLKVMMIIKKNFIQYININA